MKTLCRYSTVLVLFALCIAFSASAQSSVGPKIGKEAIPNDWIESNLRLVSRDDRKHAVDISGVSGTTVKKKDGQVVEGKITGLLVQKGKVKIETDKDGAKSYSATYVLTNGERIEAIDEKGVHSSWIMSLTATEEGQPPTDLEVVKPGEKTGPFFPRKGGKLFVTAFDFRPRVPINESLLGSIRRRSTVSGEQEAYSIVPEFEIVTKDGPVTIAVKDVIDFEEKKDP
jgi:hypothetical protein